MPKPFFAPAGPSRVVSSAEIAEVERGEIARVITVRGSAIFGSRSSAELAAQKRFANYSFQTGIFLDFRVHLRLYTAIHPCWTVCRRSTVARTNPSSIDSGLP